MSASSTPPSITSSPGLDAAFLATIIQSSDDAIISKTLEGIITSWNPGAERIFGYSANEMIGKSITILIPPDRINEEPLIIDRIKKGERVEHFDTKRLTKAGKLIDISLTISGVKDHNGIIVGASKIARDITQQKALNNALFESEQKFRNIITQTPMGIVIFRGPDFFVENANDVYLEIIDKKNDELVGRNFFDALPELKNQVHSLLTNVYTSGIAYKGVEFPVRLKRNGRIENTFFNFVYQPLRESDGNVSGIIVVASEVTDQVKTRLMLEESEKQFKNMVIQSPIAMTIFRASDFRIEIVNETLLKNIWKRELHEVQNKKLLDVFPELANQQFPALLRKVADTGVAHKENEAMAMVNTKDGMTRYYLDFEYAPLFETDGRVTAIMVTVNDVTEKVEARQRVEDAEQRIRLAAEGTGLATWDLNILTREVIYSPRLSVIFGFDERKVLTHAEMRALFHPDDRSTIVEKAFDEALVTGNYFYESRIIWPDHSIHWVRTIGKVYFDADHKPSRMLGTMNDITLEKTSFARLEENEQRLSIALESAELGTWELNVKNGQIYYSKKYLEILGHTPDFTPEHKDLLNHIHPEDMALRNKSFNEALKTGILDYEMRLIWNDKSIHWVHARGKVFYDKNQEPEKLMGTIRDVTERKAIEIELEKRVKLRTEELQQTNLKLEHSNQELEQYAYIASHDLQEPLRKIRTYAGLLYDDIKDKTDEKGVNTLQKVISSAERMSNLIHDLLNFSRLLKPETTFSKIDLNELIKEVLNDLELSINQKEATIGADHLPIVEGVYVQMSQLFYNLINNSLKFSSSKRNPVITLSCKTLLPEEVATNKNLNPKSDYFMVTLTDNGIGFIAENAEKIFEVFKRLHSREAYPGSGIGLALCRKIVLNHQGDIYAEGHEGQGASFHIILPFKQKSYASSGV